MSDYQHHPWLVRLVYKLLRGDRTITPLLGEDPFPDHPPRFVRARLYEYRFTRWGEPGGAWWSRTLVGEWLPAVSLDDPTLAPFLEESGYPVD